MQHRLTITVATDDNSHYCTVDFKLDGESIGEGNYGGEPEDNCRGRDYRWVEKVIRKLAENLGVEVEYIERKLEDDE